MNKPKQKEPCQKIKAAIIKLGDSSLEFIEPTDNDSGVAKFIKNKGEGIHHIGYRVDDCQKALDSLVAAGGRAIDEKPRPGSRGTTVAFVHPKGSFGTLIELVQENF